MYKKKLGRPAGPRRALLRSLVTAVILHDKIRTTEAKARAARPWVERMITLARRGDLHARRMAAAFLLEPRATRRLFNEIGPRYAGRNGGYTRVVKLAPRRGDAARLSLLELV